MDRRAYAAFRADIGDRGVREPLQLTAAGVVLDGRERLRAARELGIKKLPTRVVNPTDQIEYMYLCALQRRHLDPSPRAALALRLIDYQQLIASGRQRQEQNLRQQQSAEVATLPPREKTRDQLAALAGVSARTAQDVLTVEQANPALVEQIAQGQLPAHLAARRVRRERRYAQIGEAGPLPDGCYDLVYADPPWQLGHPDAPGAPEQYYPTLPTAEIAALELPAAAESFLALWAVNSLLGDALEVIQAWGFEQLTNIVWDKESIGPGVWVRNQHETLMLARRGNYPPPKPDDLPPSVIGAKRGRHSEKPKVFYELLERMYPNARKLELYARGKPRPGWTAWGNEVEQ